MQAALTLRSNLHNLVPTVVKASDGCTCHFEPSLPRQWGPMIGIGGICHSAFTTSSPPPSKHAANYAVKPEVWTELTMSIPSKVKPNFAVSTLMRKRIVVF